MKIAGRLQESFAAHSFPATTKELLDAHGDVELELPNGAVTLGDVLSDMPGETFQSAEEAQLAAYSALSEDAIGRKGYSDRDPTALGEHGHDPVSL